MIIFTFFGLSSFKKRVLKERTLFCCSNFFWLFYCLFIYLLDSSFLYFHCLFIIYIFGLITFTCHTQSAHTRNSREQRHGCGNTCMPEQTQTHKNIITSCTRRKEKASDTRSLIDSRPDGMEGSEADQLLTFERVCLEVGACKSQWFSGHSKSAFAD